MLAAGQLFSSQPSAVLEKLGKERHALLLLINVVKYSLRRSGEVPDIDVKMRESFRCWNTGQKTLSSVPHQNLHQIGSWIRGSIPLQAVSKVFLETPHCSPSG
jgi:hypothetical protein